MARSELRAGGLRQSAEPGHSLSEQQLRIATLAARGMHNQEIAERLYLSPRTVGSHLYRVYPKLGITSRHQLGAALTALLRGAELGSD
jgi:DNA-binding NarL/FixJ family response regulator